MDEGSVTLEREGNGDSGHAWGTVWGELWRPLGTCDTGGIRKVWDRELRSTKRGQKVRGKG